MSVILYSKQEVYQQMADAYEELKYVFVFGTDVEKTDVKFYKALRQLYFCNVATYLYQYDHSGFTKPTEYSFQELQGVPDKSKKAYESLSSFSHAFTSLTYNLIANDGSQFTVLEAIDTIQQLLIVFTMEVCDRLKQK